MVIGYINSTWSMPRRLALISAIFLVPSLIQLSIYASNKMGDISVVDGEIAGANLARAVWSDLASDDTRSGMANGELIGTYVARRPVRWRPAEDQCIRQRQIGRRAGSHRRRFARRNCRHLGDDRGLLARCPSHPRDPHSSPAQNQTRPRRASKQPRCSRCGCQRSRLGDELQRPARGDAKPS